MSSVTLIQPVKHDGEKYQVGEVLNGLTEKEVSRLVRLGAASMGATVTLKTEPETARASVGLTDEQREFLKNVRRKADVVAELAKLGIEASDADKLADLKDRLEKAWSGDDAGENAAISAEEEEEINNMDRDGLLSMLASTSVKLTGQEADGELRAKLKAAWSSDLKAG